MPEYCIEIGPSLTLTVPENSSPSTEVRAAPGKHGATRSRSLNAAQVSSIEAGHGEAVLQFHSGRLWRRLMTSRRRRRAPPGRQHAGQVPTVVRVAVDVARRGRAVAARPPRRPRCGLVERAPASACSTACARTGTEPMLVSADPRLGDVPPSTRTAAATATIDHAARPG